MFEHVYRRIATQIETDIQAGSWTTRLPGVGVLAKHYSVAPKTISKAIRVLAQRGLVTIHGTRGTFITRKQNNRPTFQTLGVVGFLPQFASGNGVPQAEQYARQIGYHLLLLGTPSNAPHPIVHLHRMPVDGLLFTNSTLTPDIAVRLRQEAIPFVSLNRIEQIPGLTWVDYDNEQGMELGVRELAARGHDRIAFLGYHYALDEHQHRMHQTYRRLTEQLGHYDPQLWCAHRRYMDDWYANGDDCIVQYAREMTGRLLALPDPPTAIFANQSTQIQGMMQAISQAGLELGKDIMICFQAFDRSQALDAPGLLPIYSDASERMARGIGYLVDLLIHPGKPPVQTLLPYQLAGVCAEVDRPSSALPRR